MAQLKAGVGAADTLFQHEKPNKPNRSAFDLSRITNFTCDAGMIVPFDWFFCLPGDDVDINFEMILDTLPLVNPSLTAYKVTTHWYKIDCKDLWQGWQTFITKGRSGNVNWNLPKVDLDIPFTIDSFDFGNSHTSKALAFANSQHSLGAFLGVPPTRSGIYKFNVEDNPYLESNYLPYYVRPCTEAEGGTSDADSAAIKEAANTGFYSILQVNALPFMAYQNIVKYNYVNSNLLQDNHSLFPVEGDHDWFLKTNASVTNFVDYASNNEITGSEVYNINGVYSSSDTVTRLDLLRYAMFDDDYFTTGLPWITRGTAPDTDLEVTIPQDFFKLASENMELVKTNLGGPIVAGFGYEASGDRGVAFPLTNPDYDGVNITNVKTVPLAQFSDDSLTGLYNLINKIKVVQNQSATNPTANLTANLLREMLAMSVWQERNAHVDGSYNAMIFEHWASNPHAEEHKPQYIGGTADYVNFATILQSSQSTSDSPLGSTAGRGSAGGNGSVGHVHCDDYCYIMGVMIIKPNTTYMQGVEHHLCCENVFEDFPQPEFEGLSPQPILNKELYVGTDNLNDDLFGYQERYVYLKARQNVNRGLFQCKPDKDRLFGSFTQARWFASRPSLSYQFLCMSPDNIRRDWLAYPSQPMFKLQTASKVKVVRNLAYTSRPNTFGF